MLVTKIDSSSLPFFVKFKVMINNYSVVDGLRVVMGNFLTQVSLLIILLAYARPTDFTDDSVTDKADKLFY